jgi:hypothetical protein
MFKSNPYLIGKTEKNSFKNFKLRNSHIRKREFLIFVIKSEAESSELFPAKNCIKDERLDDEKPSNQ